MKELLTGKQIAEEILENSAERIRVGKQKYDTTPCVAIVYVGDDEASRIYAYQKRKACARVGIRAVEYGLEYTASTEDVIELLYKLDSDDGTHGIMVQTPLPKHIDADRVFDSILYSKDIDGVTQRNVYKLYKYGHTELGPCTAEAVVALLDHYNTPISGARVVVVGRSDTVGKPLTLMLTQRDATVTIVHTKTKKTKEITKQADILILATGDLEKFDDTYIKEGATVIDVGIGKGNGNKTVGDFNQADYNSSKKARISKVPGGVGAITTAISVEHIVYAWEKISERKHTEN